MGIDPSVYFVTDYKSLRQLICHQGESQVTSYPHCLCDIVCFNDHIQVIVRARLFPQESVNPPTTLYPNVNPCHFKGIDHLDDVFCVHHTGIVVGR